MANTNSTASLLELDFADLKESFKTYLRTQPQFKDYDFDGSNVNVLLDLLAYNTYKNNFYHNMVISEMFLDSAQLRPSVVSHAKELNYLPRSRKSAKAKIKVDFTATRESAPYFIPKGSPFTALVKNQAFTFTTAENIVCTSGNTSFSFTTNIYEGVYTQDSYIVDISEEFPKYRITNKNVDIDSLTVSVYEDGSDTAAVYKKTDTLLGLSKDSQIFFIQAVDNGFYEILFGDNFFGKKPKAGSTVVLEYRTSSGPVANGSKQFSVDFDPTNADELISTPELTVLEVSADGLYEQTTESIRLYAPRYFASQQRAVATDDYKSIILSKFSGTIDDVTVYGGETTEQKLYGRVVIALKPTSSTIAPDFIKDEISTYMKEFISLPTRIILTDPDYFYLSVNSVVQYDTTVTDKTPTEIQGIVKQAIQTFSTDNLEKFDLDFRYSRFVNAIDNADGSITSNDTTITLIKELFPKTNDFNSYNINYNNQLQLGNSVFPVVTSSAFTYQNDDGTTFPLSYIKDDGQGVLQVYTISNNKNVILNSNIGSVNYTTGLVLINKLKTTFYDEYLCIHVITAAKDIIMNKNKLMYIDPEDVKISVIGTIQ